MAATIIVIGLAIMTPQSACRPPMSLLPMPMMDDTPFTIFGAQVMIVPTDVSSLPMITSRGPMAATTRPIFTMTCCCAGVRALNLSTRFWMKVATFRMVGASASPMEVTRTSMELFSFSSEPPKPLIMASAISSVVPAQFRRDVSNSPTSSGAVLISASHGAIWFLPKIADAAAICSDSESFPKASCSSFWIWMELFIVPSELVTEMPSLSIISAPSLAGETRRARPVFRELAALSASIPLLAMMPM